MPRKCANGITRRNPTNQRVEALDPLAFPLHVRATLASETKVASILDTHLEAEIDAKGTLKVAKFASGPGPVKRDF